MKAVGWDEPDGGADCNGRHAYDKLLDALELLREAARWAGRA